MTAQSYLWCARQIRSGFHDRLYGLAGTVGLRGAQVPDHVSPVIHFPSAHNARPTKPCQPRGLAPTSESITMAPKAQVSPPPNGFGSIPFGSIFLLISREYFVRRCETSAEQSPSANNTHNCIDSKSNSKKSHCDETHRLKRLTFNVKQSHHPIANTT